MLKAKHLPSSWLGWKLLGQLTRLFLWCLFLNGKPASLWKITASCHSLLCKDTYLATADFVIIRSWEACIPHPRSSPPCLHFPACKGKVLEWTVLLANQRGGVKRRLLLASLRIYMFQHFATKKTCSLRLFFRGGQPLQNYIHTYIYNFCFGVSFSYSQSSTHGSMEFMWYQRLTGICLSLKS